MTSTAHITLIGILIGISTLTSAILATLSKPHSSLKITWGLFNLSVFLWAIGFSYGLSHEGYESGLTLARIYNIFALYIPAFFLHFVLILTELNSKQKILIKIVYSLCGIITILAIYRIDLFIPSTSDKLGYLNYANPGLYYNFYAILFFCCVSYAHILLFTYAYLKPLPHFKKNQIKYVFWGTLIGFSGGGSTFLLVYNIPIPPLGAYLIPVYVATVSYAIFKHKLMDIQIVLNKGILYSLLISAISLIYLFSVLISETFFRGFLGYNSVVFSLLIATIIAIIFIPVRNYIQTAIDKLFFKGSYSEIAEHYGHFREEAAQKEKFKAVATLASGLAHEIRNPITTLKTFVEHVPSKMNDPQFMEKFKKMTHKEFARIENLLNNLLDYSKPSNPELADVDVHAVINETLDLLSSDLVKHKISVEKSLSADRYPLSADKNQLKQVFLNLFINAIDAMPSGGLLRVETEVCGKKNYRKHRHPEPKAKDLKTDSSASLHSPQNDDTSLPLKSSDPLTLKICISDNGHGIPPDKLKSIWDPFMTTKDHGTGLGLSIVKGIVENHGGKIKAESKLNVGTVFSISFDTENIK